MQIAMVMQWEGIKSGHGQAGVANAMRGFELLAKWQEQGKILSHRTYLGMQRTGGFSVVTVEQESLMGFVLDPEFAAFDTECAMLWDNWQWNLFLPDDQAQDALQAWAATATALA
jgi:hypothetical protein